MKRFFLYSLILFSVLQLTGQEEKEIFYADPTVFVQNGKYYLTGTGGSARGLSGFSMLESSDLEHWSVPGNKKDSIHMILSKSDHTYGSKGFWAPQIFKDDNNYYFAYTANEQTILAKSNSVLGPYTQKEVGPIDGSEKNIDPYLFKDEDGKYYLYHVRFSKGNYLWVAEFDLQKGKIKPETLKRCLDNTEPWEATSNFKSAPIMEGPTVMKFKDKYYLFYSANHFKNIDYAVGYAVADSPYGPWKKQSNSPIIHRSIVDENGSGHGDIFKGINDQLYYVYHVHFNKDQVSPRRTRIIPLNKKWDEEANQYSFSVDSDNIIVPVRE